MDWTQVLMALVGLAASYLTARRAGVKDAKASVQSSVELGLARGSALLTKMLADGKLSRPEIAQLVAELGVYAADSASVFGKPHVKRWTKKTAVFTKYASEALDAIVERQAEREAMRMQAGLR